MKKCLSLFLSLVIIFGITMSCPVTVFAAGTAGLQYELNDDGKSYYVDGYLIFAKDGIIEIDEEIDRERVNAMIGDSYD